MADIQIHFAAPVLEPTAAALIAAVTDRVNAGGRSVMLAISSPGGQVFWGVSVFHFLRGLGIPISTHNVGQVDSIASVMFAAGETRLSVPEGRFLLHGVSMGVQGGASFSRADLVNRIADLDHDTSAITAILAGRTARPEAEVACWLDGQRIMSAQEAQAVGLVTGLSTAVFDASREIVRITGAPPSA
jgi:ATP-dependent protease ClpP protease subunit